MGVIAKSQRVTIGCCLTAATLILCNFLTGCSDQGHESPDHDHAAHSAEAEGEERRITIALDVAEALGIVTEQAGPARLQETIDVFGKVIAKPESERALRARFPGQITEVHVALGDKVTKGQALLTINSDESLRAYTISAPIAGEVTMLAGKVGEQAHDDVLLRILDSSAVSVELAAFPTDITRVKVGAAVQVIHGQSVIPGQVTRIAPELNANQSTPVFVDLSQTLPIGATIQARIVVDEYEVPLAVRRSGLQTFRDSTVVYTQVGNEYGVRMLELGREAGDWVEVLGGLEAGTRYVVANSYVIKAEMEKSGASHDH